MPCSLREFPLAWRVPEHRVWWSEYLAKIGWAFIYPLVAFASVSHSWKTARKLCSASGCFNFIHTTPEISHCKKRPLTSHDWGQITYSLRNYHTGKTHGPSEGLYKHPILLQQQQNGYHSFVFVVYNTYIHIYNIILLSLGHMKSTSMVHCTLKAWLNTAASVQHCSFTLHCVWRGGSRWSYSY